MLNKKHMLACFIFWLTMPLVYAQANDEVGQTIQIYTRLHSFVGKPSWLLIIRDLDQGRIFPYLYDIKKGDNVWLAFTYSRNYKITVSELQFNPYKDKITNFCGLQDGVISGTSMTITITGNLTPDPNTFTCRVLKYQDAQFTIDP